MLIELSPITVSQLERRRFWGSQDEKPPAEEHLPADEPISMETSVDATCAISSRTLRFANTSVNVGSDTIDEGAMPVLNEQESRSSMDQLNIIERYQSLS